LKKFDPEFLTILFPTECKQVVKLLENTNEKRRFYNKNELFRTMIKFSLAKCKTKAAYSAKLLQKGKLDLAKIKKKFEILMETPILLVIKTKTGETIVHSHGEILFKKCTDTELMEKIAEKIYRVGLSE